MTLWQSENNLNSPLSDPFVFCQELHLEMPDPFILPTADLFIEFPIKFLHVDTCASGKACVDFHLNHHYLSLKKFMLQWRIVYNGVFWSEWPYNAHINRVTKMSKQLSEKVQV